MVSAFRRWVGLPAKIQCGGLRRAGEDTRISPAFRLRLARGARVSTRSRSSGRAVLMSWPCGWPCCPTTDRPGDFLWIASASIGRATTVAVWPVPKSAKPMPVFGSHQIVSDLRCHSQYLHAPRICPGSSIPSATTDVGAKHAWLRVEPSGVPWTRLISSDSGRQSPPLETVSEDPISHTDPAGTGLQPVFFNPPEDTSCMHPC